MFNIKKSNADDSSPVETIKPNVTHSVASETPRLSELEEQTLLAWLQRLSHADCTRSEIGSSPLFAAVEAIQKRFLAIASELAYSSGCIEKSSSDLNRRSNVIRDRVKEISAEITEMGDLSSGLSLNMSTVASATEELSINMKDIAHAAEENRNFAAKIAQSTTHFSESAKDIVANTSRAAHVTLKAKNEALDTMARVAGLETATNEIGEVTEAIAEIAEQTKLLALNATIEAARAGVAGRGFAVVAKEVKDLALQTNNATIDIRERINAIQEESRQTIAAINSISTIIEEVAGVVGTIEHSSKAQSHTYVELQEMTAQNNIRVEQIFANVEMGASAVQDVNVTLNEVSSLTKKVSTAISRISDETGKVSRETVSTYAQALENSGQGKYVSDLLREMTLPSEILRIADSVHPELCRFTPAFSVNVEQFNDDHRKIFSMINEIHRLVKEQKDGSDLLRVMKELATFCVGHFEREEIQLKRLNYPDFDNHKRIHENLLGKVGEILTSAEKGEELDLIAILSFLKEWLYNHIQGVDKLYGPFLNEHGYN